MIDEIKQFIEDYQPWSNLGLSILIFLLFLWFRKIFANYIYKLVLKLVKKTPSEILQQLFVAFEQPLRWLFVILGIYVAMGPFPYFEQDNPSFIQLIRISIIILIAWGFNNLASNSAMLFKRLNENTRITIDDILIPFISRAVQFIVLAISFIIVIEELGYNISGFIAGLGLGGLAFALAAQDALKNLFGGVVIITEKPFGLGDWIKTPSVEGTVEDISFRSTKVRTFAQALVIVPNSTLSNEAIMNWSEMGKRRINFNLGVEYKTPRYKLQRVVERIEEMLRNHEEVHPETIFVTFDEYSHNSLDIFLYFFTKTTVWEKYLKAKQDINFKIMDILEEEDVSVAFPTRTVHIDSNTETITNKEESNPDS
ncbi:mechanosensitive ion channel family protein [Bacillaceae bacterium W0354]